MIKVTFEFLDGEVWMFNANTVKHYSGHAAIEDATLVHFRHHTPWGINLNETVKRFNVALYGLRSMLPVEIPEPKEFVANCTGWCPYHPDTLTTSGKCPKCEINDLPF
jgi:hypothetical protein